MNSMFGQLEGVVNPYGGSSPTPTPTPSASPKFVIGDRIETIVASTNVRSAPDGTAPILGTQPLGAQGTVLEGPTLTNGVNWYNINYDNALDGWSFDGNLAKVTATPSPTPTLGPVACSQYTPSSTIPTGYASPYDVVSSPSTNLMNATCDVSSARIDLGKGDPLQYIYNQGYLFKTGGTSWTPVPYTSTESLIANAWYPKTATSTISLTSTELTNPSYSLAYICSWTGSNWKCGCRDSACTQSYWQIQSFKR